MARSRRPTTRREYPREARLNELLREILAEELERVDDDRLELVTVTGVDVDRDLRHAMVFFDCLDGPEGDAEVLEALAEQRVRLQGAIGRQARVRRVPELAFRPDPAVRGAARIEEVLRDLEPVDGEGEDGAADGAVPAGAADGAEDGVTAERGDADRGEADGAAG